MPRRFRSSADKTRPDSASISAMTPIEPTEVVYTSCGCTYVVEIPLALPPPPVDDSCCRVSAPDARRERKNFFTRDERSEPLQTGRGNPWACRPRVSPAVRLE